MVKDGGTRKRQLLGSRAIHADIFGKREAWMTLNLSIMSCRCSAFFLSTLVSCQFLSHSCWDDEELYGPPKTQTFFFQLCHLAVFLFYRQSAERYICWHIDGVVCVWGEVYMYLCSSVYVMGRGVAGWYGRGRMHEKSSEMHEKVSSQMFPEVHLYQCRVVNLSLLLCNRHCWNLPTRIALRLFKGRTE